MSNFKIWIDTPIGGTNVVASEAFGNDTQRQNGFKAGTPASSILVNTALRQSNLVTTALMETIGESANDLSVLSTLDDVKNVINAYMLNSSSRTVEFTQESSRTNLISRETLSKSLGKISRYFSDLDNPNVVGCQKANVANYASSDTSKGTIEERLTNLGFKTGSTTTGEFTWSSTAQTYFDTTNSYINGYRQGNYVILEIYLKPNKSYWGNIFSMYTNLIQWNSAEIYRIFGPKNNQEIKFNILGTFDGSLYGLNNFIRGRWEMGTSGRVGSFGVTIAGFGANNILLSSINYVNYFEFNKIQVGYEANPL